MNFKLDSAKCTACNLCVLACSAGRRGVFSPARSHIRVFLADTDGLVKKRLLACTLCLKCVKTCPFDAISSNGKWLTLDKEKCTGCGNCVEVCPQNAIFMDEENKAALPDFCQGNPACVAACPHQALQLMENKS